MKLLKFLRVPRFSSSEKSTQKIQRKLKIRVSKKQIYQEAFTHSSANLKNSNGQTMNFERLEFLGDALLASIVAEYLFEYYPNAKEGELTKLRAKIVSRSKLNEIGKRMDLFKFAKISDPHKNFGEDIHGNLLESLIGAIFVDKGYIKTKKYIVNEIILPYVDIKNLDKIVLSHKAYLIEWGQKEKKEIEFITQESGKIGLKSNYLAEIFLDKQFLTKSKDTSKKRAEEKAAKIAVRILKIRPESS